MFTKKVLCFTTSYNRQKFLRGCILDILNQTYPNIVHTINFSMDDVPKDNLNEKIFDDLISDRVKITYSKNSHQHENHMNAIYNIKNLNEFDIFVKIDDDEIYKRDYIKTIVDNFENVDVVSSKMKYQLNGSKIFIGDYNNLGGNPHNCDFKIPSTFAFNLRALNLIKNLNKYYGFEDNMWRHTWCGNTKIKEIDNSENIIWYIHGKNTSTSEFLIK